MVIFGYTLGTLSKKTFAEIREDNILTLAASSAYNFFFSLFPLFLFLAPMLSFIGKKEEMVNAVLASLASVLPPEAITLIAGVLHDVLYTDSAPSLISVGALLAAYTGSNIIVTLMQSLNVAYDVQETRPWWKQRLLGLAVVVFGGLVVLIAMTLVMSGEGFVRYAEARLGLTTDSSIALSFFQYLTAFLMLVGLLWVVYLILPNVHQRKLPLLIGSVITAVVLILAAVAFRFYVQNFGAYNKTYGAIGAVIILLTWMYLTMLVVLSGGELNSEIAHGSGAVESRKATLYGGRIGMGEQPVYPSTKLH
jgi:membrane protein